ncbi:MAG: hypothetical protein D6816_17485, partial [Bacteroidetes bacterium]
AVKGTANVVKHPVTSTKKALHNPADLMLGNNIRQSSLYRNVVRPIAKTGTGAASGFLASGFNPLGALAGGLAAAAGGGLTNQPFNPVQDVALPAVAGYMAAPSSSAGSSGAGASSGAASSGAGQLTLDTGFNPAVVQGGTQAAGQAASQGAGQLALDTGFNTAAAGVPAGTGLVPAPTMSPAFNAGFMGIDPAQAAAMMGQQAPNVAPQSPTFTDQLMSGAKSLGKQLGSNLLQGNPLAGGFQPQYAYPTPTYTGTPAAVAALQQPLAGGGSNPLTQQQDQQGGMDKFGNVRGVTPY